MPTKKFTIVTTKEERKQSRKELLPGLLSGVLLGLSFPPIPLYPLLFVALVPYLYVLERRESLASINRFTYATIFVYNFITLYWVGSWQPDTDPFLMIAGIALLFFNPIVFLIPSTLYYFARKAFNKRTALFLLPFFWGSMEYLYGLTDFRFPWLTLGHSLPYFQTFIQVADIIGSFGLGILVIFINIFLYKSFVHFKNKEKYLAQLSAGIILIIIPVAYGLVKISNYVEPEKKINVGVIQPNLNPWNKWQAGNLDEQLELYLELSEKEIANDAQIIIWPETALPVYLLTGGYGKQVYRIRKFCDTNNVVLMTGMPDANFYFDDTEVPEDAKLTNSGTKYTSYNSILLFEPGNADIQKYGKIKLVPFGEKVPLVEYIPFLGDLIKWNVGISSWNTGKKQTVFETKIDDKKINIAGVVCIESIYPVFVSEFVKEGAELIVVVTNDSWYGDSSGPYQHKEISVLRAIENRRSVVRSANGGISCVINPVGETLVHTNMYERTSFTYPVTLQSNLTFYTKYPLILPIVSIFAAIFVILAFVINKFRTKRS